MPTYYRADRMVLRDEPDAVDRLARLIQENRAEKIDKNSYSPMDGIIHDVTWQIVPGAELYRAARMLAGQEIDTIRLWVFIMDIKVDNNARKKKEQQLFDEIRKVMYRILNIPVDDSIGSTAP